VLRAHGIYRVPLNLIFGDQALRDGVDITPAQFLERMRAGAHPTTSQPAPGAFAEAFRLAARDGEAIVAVMLGAGLSGTFASAEAAAKLVRDVPIHVVDSGRASLSQGMLVLRAAELVEQGWTAERIVPELERIRGQSGILFTLDTYDRLLASGRVGRGRALLGTLLDIKPILAIDDQGRVTPAARVRGARNVLPRVLEILEAAIPKDAKRVRFGVIQIAAEETAAEVAEALRARFGARDIIISPATPVIATHTGPGTWGVAYQVED
jgi:DegV family protein with EDD domain